MEKLREMNHIERNQPQSSTQLMFRFFHRVITYESIGKVAFSILVVLETLQLINYALHPTYPNLWRDSLFLLLQKVLSMTDLSVLWLATGGFGLLIFIIIGFTAFSLALIFVANEQCRPPDDRLHYSARLIAQQQIGTIKFRYVFWLAMLTKTVLVVPYSYACAAFLNPNLYSFAGSMQTLLMIFSLLGFLSMGGICFLFISFIRDNSPFSKQPFCGAVSENEEMVLVIKVVMSVYASLRNGQVSSQNTFICVLFLFSLVLLLRNYYSKPSYYAWPQNRIFEIGPLIVLTLGLTSLFQQLVVSEGSAGIYVALVVQVPLAIFTWLHVRKEHVKGILYSNYSLLTSSNQVLIYNYQCIFKIIGLHEKENLIQLEGILDYHVSNCKKSAYMCACSSVRNKLSEDGPHDPQEESVDNEQTLWYQFVRSNLLEAREKYSTVTEIYFLLAHVEKLKMKNKYKALHNLQEASSQSTLKYDFLAYSLLRDIEKQMGEQDQMRNEHNPIDINKYFIFESNFGKLKEKIEMFTESHIAFWSSLLGAVSKEECSNELKIARQIKQIRQLSVSLTNANPNNIQLMVLLQSFNKLILNSSQSDKMVYIQRKEESVEPEKQKYGDNSQTAIIMISGERKNIGVIKHCNENIKRISGYTTQELLGQNINVLMPEFIGNMHDDVLRNYLELSQSKFDYIERLAPIVDANNFLVLCRILTKAFPSLLSGLELVGFVQAVREHHIRHRNQTPKYVLFRSDTGMVQAMSQNCLKQFSYQINEVDRKNQISSELTISTLFYNLREGQIPLGEEGVNSFVTIVDEAHPQDSKQVPVVIYQRMQIFYYGVKLRLIYFFTKQSSEQLRMNSTMKELASEIDSEKNTLSEEIISAKQRHLNSQAQKESFLEAEPFLFRLFCNLNLAIMILVGVTSIGFAVFDILDNSDFQNCKSISELSAQTVHQVASINLLVRLTQLTAFYPELTPSFDPNILSQLISLLQTRQFQIASLYLSLPSITSSLQQEHSSLVTFWSISQAMVPLSTEESLDSNIFDYVTSASSFKQSNSQQIPLNLLSGQIPFSQIYQDLFHIRYTGLFEALPHKQSDLRSFDTYFHSLFAHERSMGLLRLALICTCLTIVTVVLVCFDCKIQTLVNQQAALFGFLTVAEVQYQVDKCRQFFQRFYHDSYQYKLRKAEIDAQKLNVEQKKDEYTQKQQNQVMEDKVLEKDKGENNGDTSEANNLLLNEKAKKDSYEEGSPKRNQMPRIADMSILKFILALFALSVAYFVLAFQVTDFSSLTTCIADLRTIYSNLNCQTMFHLYNLEAIIDNAKFKQYPLLNETAATFYNQSYDQLQNFSFIAPNLASYFSSVCDSLDSMVTAGNALPTIKFTLNQCLSLKNGILQSGLRLSIIGQLEQWNQFKSVSNLTKLFTSRQFKQSLRLRWYIEGVFNLYLTQKSLLFNELISKRTVTVFICLGVYLLVIGVYFGVLWRVKFHRILGKMKATKIIVGLIPIRSLVRNQQLTLAYEKYLADNME